MIYTVMISITLGSLIALAIHHIKLKRRLDISREELLESALNVVKIFELQKERLDSLEIEIAKTKSFIEDQRTRCERIEDRCSNIENRCTNSENRFSNLEGK